MTGYIVFFVWGIFNGWFKKGIIYDQWYVNPPGYKLWLYALSIYGLMFYLYEWLEARHERWLKILYPLEVCGRYSLNIFLYHGYLIVILSNVLWAKYPVLENNIWLKRGSLFLGCFILPIVIKIIYEKIKKFFVQETYNILKQL